MKLRLYHHPDGARVAYREAGTGPALALLHSALLSHREWEPVVEHLTDRFRSCCPTCRCTATPRTGRATPTRWTGSPRSWPGSAARRAGPRPLVGGHDLGAELLLRAVASRRARGPRARAHAQPPAPPARARRAAVGVAGGDARRRRAGARPRCSATARAGVFRPELGVRLSARAQPGRARPRAPRVRRRRRQRQPRALVGALRARAGRSSAPARAARRLRADRRPDAAAVGRRRPAAPARRRPRRRSTCCPTHSCACCPAPASSWPTTTPSASARELAAFCG